MGCQRHSYSLRAIFPAKVGDLWQIWPKDSDTLNRVGQNVANYA